MRLSLIISTLSTIGFLLIPSTAKAENWMDINIEKGLTMETSSIRSQGHFRSYKTKFVNLEKETILIENEVVNCVDRTRYATKSTLYNFSDKKLSEMIYSDSEYREIAYDDISGKKLLEKIYFLNSIEPKAVKPGSYGELVLETACSKISEN